MNRFSRWLVGALFWRVSLFFWLLIASGGSTVAQTSGAGIISYDFDDLSLGSIQGQNGWGFAAVGDIVVVDDVVSPLNGSTQAIRFSGGVTVIPGQLDTPFVNGLVTISYDFFSTTRVTEDNAVALLQFQDRNGRNPMGLYAQNGGAGPSPNGFFSDGVDPTLQPNNLVLEPFSVPPFAYPENTWLHFIGTVDLDNGGHLVYAEAFDISSGSLVSLGTRNNAVDGDLFFATLENGFPVLPELFFMNLSGFGMDNGTTLYMDNILIEGNPPLNADAGDNVSIVSAEQYVTIIHGTASDADTDDVLTYRWREGTIELLGSTAVGANGECPLDLSTVSLAIGDHTLTLEVTDGDVTATDDMILTIGNSTPNAAPTGGGVYEVGAEVVLGGDVSDYDGDEISYEWREGTDVIASGMIQAVPGGVAVTLPDVGVVGLDLGVHTISLEISDGVNDAVSAEITVEVVDISVPTLRLVPSETILWPPNHRMVDIVIEVNVADNSGVPPTLTVDVTSNEPEEGGGDGDMSPDWTEPLIDQETGEISLQLRAERSGSGDGRVYTVSITATDDSGNSSQAAVEIIVPHDKGKK